jgi:hypothetical protein
MVIEDPFEGQDSKFGVNLRFPSRSPSPRKPLAIKNLKDIDMGDTFLEDDIDLEMMKSQQALQQDKEAVDAKNRA